MGFIKKNSGLLLIFILGLIPLVGLLHPGLPITHDGKDHVARIANFYLSLSEGNIIPRWGALLNWGYGHPVMMFLYPFSSYCASLFHLLGFSLVDSVKIVFGLGFIASGISMYLWTRNAFNENVGIAAGILYMYAPYRFVDLYVRGAIGEHMAFIFPPLILYFLFKFFRKKNSPKNNYWFFVGIVLSTTSLLLSHNAISIMFLPFIVFYILYLFYQTRNTKKLLYAFLSLFLGFLLSSFFLLPAFFEGKYTLRDIVTGNEYSSRFVEAQRFIWSSWNYGISGQFSVQLGILQWMGILVFPFVLWKSFRNKDKKWVLLLGIFAFFMLSIFLQLQISQFLYNVITTLKKFQFPWRFLSLTVFTTALVGGSFFLLIKKSSLGKLFLGTIIVLALFLNFSHMRANGYLQKPEEFYSGIYYGTTDTGESSPIWSIRFMEKVPTKHSEVIEGDAQIVETKRTTTRHSYNINAISKARIKDNTVYFPGWKVYANGTLLPIEFQDPSQRGLITFRLPEGESMVNVVFEDTKLRLFSNIVSVATFLFLIGLGFYVTKKYENK